jgi:hypothetical protein
MKKVLHLYHIPGNETVVLFGMFLTPSAFAGGGSPNSVYYL